MHSQSFPAFFEELEKLGYGHNEHITLSNMTLGGMGVNQSSDVGKLFNRANVASDSGVRHPYLMGNSDVHAMPGGSKRKMLRRMVKSRNSSMDAMATAMQSGNQSAQVKAMRDLGGGTHQWADVSAHFEKPLETGKSSKALRNSIGKLPGGRTLVSATEHSLGGLKAGSNPGAPIVSHLDNLRPDLYKADRVAQKRAKNWGISIQKGLHKRMVTSGMTPEQATSAVNKAMSQKLSGGARVVGRVASDAGHVRRVTSSGVKSAVSAAPAITRTAGRVSNLAPRVAGAAARLGAGAARGGVRGVARAGLGVARRLFR